MAGTALSFIFAVCILRVIATVVDAVIIAICGIVFVRILEIDFNLEGVGALSNRIAIFVDNFLFDIDTALDSVSCGDGGHFLCGLNASDSVAIRRKGYVH